VHARDEVGSGVDAEFDEGDLLALVGEPPARVFPVSASCGAA
jgi:hypothetical protein